MRVLINAFACSPYRGSECAVGWNIPLALAQRHEVVVICGDLKSSRPTEKDLAKYGLHNIPFKIAYVAPTRTISFLERIHNLPGLWAVYYLAYNLWQRRALRRALALHQERRFDIVHQLNMIGYREPGYLWKLGIPFVWGPVGGGANEPMKYHRLFSWAGKLKALSRTLVNEFQKRACLRARSAAGCAKMIWAVTDADYHMVHDIWRMPCGRMVEVGVDMNHKGGLHRWDGTTTLRVVWSGIHTSRKALPIVILALQRLNAAMRRRVVVDILGEGPETKRWKRLSAQAGVDACLRWHGRLLRDNALELVRKAHVLACPSIKEASSVVVIEAVSLGLPVICHDACGMGIVVTDQCGIKMPLKDPETSIVGFAGALQEFLNHPERVEELSRGALARAEELTWAAKAVEISRGYEEVISGQVRQ